MKVKKAASGQKKRVCAWHAGIGRGKDTTSPLISGRHAQAHQVATSISQLSHPVLLKTQ